MRVKGFVLVERKIQNLNHVYVGTRHGKFYKHHGTINRIKSFESNFSDGGRSVVKESRGEGGGGGREESWQDRPLDRGGRSIETNR